MIKFTVPVKVTNPLNGSQGHTRGAIMAKAARRKKERTAASLMAISSLPTVDAPLGSCTVTLRRVSPRALDGDGLQAALKSVRDGIADALGINDGSDAVTWKYEHRRGKPREYAVEVEIAPKQDLTPVKSQEQTREAL